MKKFVQLITVFAIIVLAVGLYRGWFAVTGEREEVSHNVDVKLSVDTEKVKHDAESVKKVLKPQTSDDEQ
ncbi:MAG: hypothetical protein WBH50_11170 [Fuerstiella sp.]